jgi:ribonuclease BN (tRNA processing enzyme)
MELRVIGCSGGQPSHGWASSGYLVTEGETRILLDAGAGVAAELSTVLNPQDLDAVYVSHLHADHVWDIVSLGKMIVSSKITYHDGGDRPEYVPGPLPTLFLPEGGKAALDSMARNFPIPSMPWLSQVMDRGFDVVEYTPGMTAEVGGLEIVTTEMRHAAVDSAIRLTGSESSMLYTGDTGMNDALVPAARGVDLLLIENTLVEPGFAAHGHLSAREAGQVAADAGVESLVLTHYRNAGDEDRALRAATARAAYEGPLNLAQPRLSVSVPTTSAH